MNSDPSKIRNIALVGHGGVGKTTLAESMLFRAKVISEMGSIDRGNTVSSTEPEEVSHRETITPHVAHLDWEGQSINLVDTPGQFSFLESTRAILPGVGGAVFVFSATNGAKPEAERLWPMVEEQHVPMIGFINKVEEAAVGVDHIPTQIKETFGRPAYFLTYPVVEGDQMVGLIDVLERKAFFVTDRKKKELTISGALETKVNALFLELEEAIAESDDSLLEEYLESGELSLEQLQQGLKTAIVEGAFLPCLCGSALSGLGIGALLDSIVDYLPDPFRRSQVRTFSGVNPDAQEIAISRTCVDTNPFSAFTIKTVIDPFSGAVSVVHVRSGTVSGGQVIYNSTRDEKQKVGHVYRLQGKNLEQVDSLSAGEIGALSKLSETCTGDTVCSPDDPILYPEVHFAEPSVSYAVQMEGKTEEKVSSGLTRLVHEDPTLHFYRDQETNDMLIGGMGQAHLEITLERLARKYGGRAKLAAPHVPYKETIHLKVKAQGKLKKQTGGHGQFANCWLEVEPLPRGSGFVFEDKIVGGIIPKQYIPSVESGVKDAMSKGLVGGYPVVDVKVTLYDGSFHQVDSSDYAFQVAGSLAFRAAMEQAEPVLLEPIMQMEVVVPEECTGDVIKDLSSRRGKILGMETKGTKQSIKADVPLPEVLEYGNLLSSITSGRGSHTMRTSTYSEVPSQIVGKMLDAEKVAANQ